jgi:hypothetical protein
MKRSRESSFAPSRQALVEEIERARYREQALEAALIRRLSDLNAAEEKLRAMRRSLSWRVTKPLRLLVRVIRGIKRRTKTAKRLK